MCAEVCEPGAWESLFNRPNLTKFYSPSIQGIDFPALFVEKAFHDDQQGQLHFSIRDGDKTKTNQKTFIEVFNLPDANSITILCDGKEFRDYTMVDDSRISINTEVNHHNFEIRTGYFLSQQEEWDLNKKLKEVKNLEGTRSSQSPSLTSSLILPSSLNSCGCC